MMEFKRLSSVRMEEKLKKYGCVSAVTIGMEGVQIHGSMKDPVFIPYENPSNFRMDVGGPDILDVISTIGTIYFSGCDLVYVSDVTVEKLVSMYSPKIFFKFMSIICNKICTFPNDKEYNVLYPQGDKQMEDLARTYHFVIQGKETVPNGMKLTLKKY